LKFIPIKCDYIPESEFVSDGLYSIYDSSPSEPELSTGLFRASTICTSLRKQDIFPSENFKIKMNNTPTTRTADHTVTVNS
jgi:hypothetical protein